MIIKFRKKLPEHLKAVLEHDFNEYEKRMNLSKKERKLLKEWVSSGRSPYDNDIGICNRYGWPVDFVTALRMQNQTQSMTVEYQPDTGEPVYVISDAPDSYKDVF